MWEPARIVELVRLPGCLPHWAVPARSGLLAYFGTPSQAEYDGFDEAFYNCTTGASIRSCSIFQIAATSGSSRPSFDVLYLFELDPTWND